MIPFVLVLLLALIPQAVWLIVTYRHARESQRTALWAAGLAGFVVTTVVIGWVMLGAYAMQSLSGASLGSS